MELKHITHLTWNDLPGIENPFFACSAIKSDYSSATPLGFFRISGLGEALGKHASRHSPHAPQPDLRKSLGWLLDRVESGEYILVHTDSNWTAPMASVLRWSTENNRNGFQISPPGGKAIDYPEGHWKADPGLPMMLRLQIDECLEKTRRSGTAESSGPERLWWGGLLEGRRWRGGAAGAEIGEVIAAGIQKAFSRGGSTSKEARMLAGQDSSLRDVGGGTGKWTTADLLKQLCPKDKAVVDDLANTDVLIADEIYYDDPYYDGTKWTTRRFNGGGSWDGAKLLMLSKGTPESAATTAYHELVHKHQSSSMSWEDMEVDAYYKTEQWTIERGLSGQYGSDLRSIQNGKTVADKNKIRKFVKNEYPLPEDASKPYPVGRAPSGETILSDGTVRLPQKGDTYAGSEITKPSPPKKIPRSIWKCDGKVAGSAK